MKLKFSLAVYQKIMAYAAATQLEFSGLGFIDRADGDLFVYDFVILNVGSEGYTEIDPKRILPLLDREDRANMKLWLHRHPITGWSSRDLQTILKEPLGSTPEQVQWSVSAVLTPAGWIARIDNYIKGITKELEVEPNCQAEYQEVRELRNARGSFPGSQLPLPGFPQGASARWDGYNSGEEEDNSQIDEEEWEEEEFEVTDPPAAEFDYEETQNILAGLAANFHGDPYSISVGELFEEYAINYFAIQQKVKMRQQYGPYQAYRNF